MELNPSYASDEKTEPQVPVDSEMAVKPDSTLTLDLLGDVILKVGEVSLQVSSKVLSVASPVFRAMFSPHFQEGDALSRSSSTSPAVIHFPDDEASTMILLCQILHFQNDPIEDISDLRGILGLRSLAIICDKYNCMSAASLAMDTWIEYFEPDASEEDLFSLLESAYILNHATVFYSVSKRIILNDTGQTLRHMIEWTPDSILPLKVFGKLERRRRYLHQELANGLQEPIAQLIEKAEYEATTTMEDKKFGSVNHTWHKFNVHDAFQVSSYIRELRRVNLWPLDPQKHKLANILEAFNRFEGKDITQSLGFGIFVKSTQCQACMLDTRTKLATLMLKLLKGCKGMCLHCLDKDSLAGTDHECREKNKGRNR